MVIPGEGGELYRPEPVHLHSAFRLLQQPEAESKVTLQSNSSRPPEVPTMREFRHVPGIALIPEAVILYHRPLPGKPLQRPRGVGRRCGGKAQVFHVRRRQAVLPVHLVRSLPVGENSPDRRRLQDLPEIVGLRISDRAVARPPDIAGMYGIPHRDVVSF